MSVGSFIVMFAASWWVIFYITLPIGNRIGKIQKGNADSAPENPHIWVKVLITSLISLLLTLLFLYLVEIKILDLEGYFTGSSKKLINL